MRYSLGLDIGTTSIGWSVVNLDKNRIEDLGVRIFEKPEVPKTGASLAEPRRIARGTRRRLHRRRERLNYLKDFFDKTGLLSLGSIKFYLTPGNYHYDPYELRRKGLSEKLEPKDLFLALYHIAKRRGYKSNRKSVEEKDPEGSKVLSAIAKNAPLLDQTKSIAAVMLTSEEFQARKRNGTNNYSHSFARQNFLDELYAILKKQAEYYPDILTESSISHLVGATTDGNMLHDADHRAIFYQRPFMTSELIQKMRGKCTLEPTEWRAPKASLTFEIFRLAQDLTHVTYSYGISSDESAHKDNETFHTQRTGDSLTLTKQQISDCIDKAKQVGKLTYRHIREIIGYKDDPNFRFDYIRGKEPKEEDLAKDSNAKEKNTFGEMRFYHAVKKVLKDLPDDWTTVDSSSQLFDQIGEILSTNKDDKSMAEALAPLLLSDNAKAAILPLEFSGFAHLSIKALQNITPYLLEGMTYDKAVESAYPGRFTEQLSGHGDKLPPLNDEQNNQITNPVVKRAVSQTIKVVNAVIRKHGLPARIGVECAGDLAKSFDERKKIKKAQDDNAAQNEKIKERLETEFNVAVPTGLQISKMKFFEEQDDRCLYCGIPLDPNRLFSDQTYAEIDHIIPFSRCGNDSRANKALVCAKCNQEKRNQTPYEAWGNDDTRWQQFETRVNANVKIRTSKKSRLLATTPPKEDWNQRAINDTRYISKFIARHIKSNLKFNHENDDDSKQRVIMPAGSITTYLRRIWHIPHKDRDADNLHHSVDATIIACTTQGIIMDCAKYSSWLEAGSRQVFGGGHAGSFKLARMTNERTGEVIDTAEYEKLQHDMLPWDNFAKELMLRESQPKENDTLAIWRDQFRDIYKDQDETFRQSIHPIFVSRMPNRKGTGAVNDGTNRSPKVTDDNHRLQRMNLSNVKLSNLENSVLLTSDHILYEQLKKLLEDNNDNPKKAFAEPVYKNNVRVDKNGKPLAPVKTIKVYSTRPSTSGFYVNQGRTFVNNGDMIRVDIYSRPNNKGITEHFIVPIYAHQVKTGSTKIMPVPKKGPTNVDDSFTKVCSLYPNDYVRMYFDKQTATNIRRHTNNGDVFMSEGYYANYDISGSKIAIISHCEPGRANTIRVAQLSARRIERLDINVLGDNYPWE